MTNYSVSAENIRKNFGRRLIFNGINFNYSNPGVYGIAGSNGSGKSTLVKIISGINAPTAGKIIHTYNEKKLTFEHLHNHIGLVSPYLVLYDEFTAYENLNYFAKIRNVPFDKEKIDDLLNRFLLLKRKDDFVKGYSSGMKQRLKFIFALQHSPNLLILDEPVSNLDNEGKDTVYKIIENESKNTIVMVASNEENDLSLCSEIIYLENYKTK